MTNSKQSISQAPQQTEHARTWPGKWLRSAVAASQQLCIGGSTVTGVGTGTRAGRGVATGTDMGMRASADTGGG